MKIEIMGQSVIKLFKKVTRTLYGLEEILFVVEKFI